ncbi:MAG TPA: PQQ-binding-like beta-propeller repeat protein [Acidimicrobiales bacterium]|nr:PQQ-binding-like beta-propeller repeat protein [Acidimicrobiales bacterium]
MARASRTAVVGGIVGVAVAALVAGAVIVVARDDGGSSAAEAAGARVETAARSGDAGGEGHSAHPIRPGDVGQLTQAWRVDGQVGVTGKPTVRGHTVYFGNWAGSVVAADLRTGEVAWSTPVTARQGLGIDGAALVTARRVYVGDADGMLHALSRDTGQKVWSTELDAHPQTRIFSTPVLVPPPASHGHGLIVIGVASTELVLDKADFTFRGSVVGLDAASGEIRWRLPVSAGSDGAGSSVWSSAAIDRQRHLAFIGTGQAYEHPAGHLSDSLLAIRYDTGKLAWSRQFTADDVWTFFAKPPVGPDADIGATPSLFRAGGRDLVGVGDKAGTFDVFDRKTGETVWARELTKGSMLGGVMVTAAVGPKTIYVTSNEMDRSQLGNVASDTHHSTLFALDARTGAVRWQKSLPGATFGSITYADGVVYRPSVPGVLQAFDARTGELLWSSEPGGDMGAGVRVVDGWLLVPHGFWFIVSPPNPIGGVVAYRVAK